MISNKNIYRTLLLLFTGNMLVSAYGELIRNPTVVDSMHLPDMPLYLLTLLGVLKILGLVALWMPGFSRLKEWAYAGFAFDFIGAIFGFLAVGQPVLPDIVMAPLALTLLVGTYLFYHRSQATNVPLSTVNAQP